MPSMLTVLCLTACTTGNPEDSLDTPQAPDEAPSADTISVTSALVFLPKWEGAQGFSAGGKYAISAGDLFGEDRSAYADGQHIVGLPTDGKPALVFAIVGASLSSETVEVTAVERGGEKFTGEDVELWIVQGSHNGRKIDTGKVRLVTALDGDHRPHGEGEHLLSVAIDLNSDGKPDYAEFTHHCKAEGAPYPITDEQRAAWETEHGETDWDLSCRNVYTIDNGKWTSSKRETPM